MNFVQSDKNAGAEKFFLRLAGLSAIVYLREKEGCVMSMGLCCIDRALMSPSVSVSR